MAFSKLAREKLADSDLTVDDAQTLGIESLTAAQTKKLYSAAQQESLKINYYDLQGNQQKKIYRLRLLGDPPVGAFGEQEKGLRYRQAPNTSVAAYFAKTIPWGDIVNDTTHKILITEGELKAACACKHGFPTIGLGGVYSWRSSKMGWGFLPELEKFEFAKREVFLCFDSDANQNQQVTKALLALCKELRDRGAIPHIATIPDIFADGKTGLDDYIVEEGKVALGKHLLASEAVIDDLSVKLWEFNTRFLIAKKPPMIYDIELDSQINLAQFRLLVGNEWAYQKVDTSDGEKVNKVLMAKEWTGWPKRRQTDRLTYYPGKPQEMDGEYNLWRGFAVEPVKGPIKPWKDLIKFIFSTADDPAHALWFEQWCGYPIKFPGTKQASAAGIWSSMQGVGKSLIGFILGKIYGHNFSLIDQYEFESAFNSWCVGKQFIMVDDISPHNSRSKADYLKKLITQPEMQVHIKYVPGFSLPDFANYYLTSNHPDALYLDDQDRRFFVHHAPELIRETEFYDRIGDWMHNGGPSHLMHYFTHDLEYSGYSPQVKPPTTSAKLDMIDDSRGELNSWLIELMRFPDQVLRMGDIPQKRDLYTAGELVMLFDLERKGRPVTANSMSRNAKLVFPMICNGKKIRIGDEVLKLFIVRNKDKWAKASMKQVITHRTTGESEKREKKY